MKNTKRIIAAVLTVIMMISMLPSNAFATESAGNDAAESAVEAVSVPGEEQEIESTMEAVSEETAEAVQESSEEVQTVENAEPAAAEETEQTAEIPVEGTVLYPEMDLEGKAGHVTVKVHAPEGALPEGTELKVEEVKKSEVEDLVNEATEDAVNDFVAVDVSFHVNGQEEDFAPLKEVKVEFVLDKDVLPETESYDVIHVAVDEEGKETPEVIEEEKIIDEITAEGGTISQKEFSVFIIAAKDTSSSEDTDDPEKPVKAVETWYFYSDLDSLKEDKASYEEYVQGLETPESYSGETVREDILTNEIDGYTQAVKKGDELLKPVAEETEHEIFVDWVEYVSEEEQEKTIAFGTITNDILSGNVHFAYALKEEAYYVIFHDYAEVTGEREPEWVVKEVRKGKDGDTVNTDVRVETNAVDKIHSGWTTDPTGDPEAEGAENFGLLDSVTIKAPESEEEEGNIDLYPVFEPGIILTFDGNGSETAEASYTAPQYLAIGEKPARPENPTRPGYKFVDWYEHDDAGEPAETPFNFDEPVVESKTVYAEWSEDETTYTVIIWRQKATDGINADPKTYDYYKSFVESAETGSVVGAGDYTNLTPSAAEEEGHPYEGFEYASADENVIVNGDGSSIVNVYYDRKIVKYTFQTDQDLYIYVGPDYEGEEERYDYNEDAWPTGYYRGDRGPNAQTGDKWGTVDYNGRFRDTLIGNKQKKFAHCNVVRIPILIPPYDRSVYYTDRILGCGNPLAFYYHYVNQSGYVSDPDGEYIKLDGHTISGLYGSTFEENGYSWPGGGTGEWYFYKGQTRVWMSVLATFIPEFGATENGPYDIVFHNEADDANLEFRIPVYFYKETDTDGVYQLANQGLLTTSTTFHFEQKYKNTHQLYAYVVGDLASSENDQSVEVIGGVNPDQIQDIQLFRYEGEDFTPKIVDVSAQSGSSGDIGGESTEALHVFFKRKSFDVAFHNVKGNEDQIVKTYRYMAEIQNLDDAEIKYPVESEQTYYEFGGWYADPQHKNAVTIGEGAYETMPYYNLAVYAKWDRVKAKVTLDANEGVFSDGEASKTVPVTYGDNFDASSYNSQVTRAGYEFLGWVMEKETGTPWSTSIPVTKDITLVAKWRYMGTVKINYYTDENTLFETNDNNVLYRDKASAVVTYDAPDDLEDEDPVQYFKCWNDKADGSGRDYYAGQLCQIDAESEDVIGGVKKLYAVYSPFKQKETLIRLYPYHENAVITFSEDGQTGTEGAEGDEAYIEWTVSLVNHTQYDLANVTGTCEGYKLIGWAKTPDGDKVFDVTDVVTADELDTNALYAVWEELDYYYIYHSSKPDEAPEKCLIPESGTENLTGKVCDGFMYGGYYDYDESASNRRGAAITDKPGTEMNPEKNKIYYLKEVSESYLVPQLYAVYRNVAGPQLLRKLYVFTNIDELETYKDAGVTITVGEGENAVSKAYSYAENNELKEDGASGMYKTLTIDNKHTGKTETYSAKDMFGVDGYFGSVDASEFLTGNADRDRNIVAYYVTQDNVKVTGEKAKAVNIGNGEFNNWKPEGIRFTITTPGTTAVAANNSVDGDDSDGSSSGQNQPDNLLGAGRRLVNKGRLSITNGSEVYTITKIDGGNTVEQKVEDGDNTGKITWAGKDKCIFAGWYMDSKYQTPADFSNVTGNMTVYAKYVSISNVKLSFDKKSAKSGTVEFKSTLKVTAASDFTDVAVECNFKDTVYAVDFTGVKEAKSGKNVVKTYTGTVTFKGLVNKSVFSAIVSYKTADGTSVTLDTLSCKYTSGYVTIK